MNAPDRLDSVRVPLDKRKVSYEADTRVPNAGTFTLLREDHTLGHMLRMELLRDPSVRFAGYKHPHPLDNHIELRVQVSSSSSSAPAAVRGAAERLTKEMQLLQASFREQVRAAEDARRAADEMA
jgi:DNA-directed RNA polymerase II subunit RPB11